MRPHNGTGGVKHGRKCRTQLCVPTMAPGGWNTDANMRPYCDGLLIKEIAEKLSISDRTVEKHRASIMEKTGSRNDYDPNNAGKDNCTKNVSASMHT